VHCGPWLAIQSYSIPADPWPLQAHSSLPVSLNPQPPRLFIFYVVFLFAVFLPLWLLQFVLAFYGLASFQHDRTI
jgi:hypothetical protein